MNEQEAKDIVRDLILTAHLIGFEQAYGRDENRESKKAIKKCEKLRIKIENYLINKG